MGKAGLTHSPITHVGQIAEPGRVPAILTQGAHAVPKRAAVRHHAMLSVRLGHSEVVRMFTMVVLPAPLATISRTGSRSDTHRTEFLVGHGLAHVTSRPTSHRHGGRHLPPQAQPHLLQTATEDPPDRHHTPASAQRVAGTVTNCAAQLRSHLSKSQNSPDVATGALACVALIEIWLASSAARGAHRLATPRYGR